MNLYCFYQLPYLQAYLSAPLIWSEKKHYPRFVIQLFFWEKSFQLKKAVFEIVSAFSLFKIWQCYFTIVFLLFKVVLLCFQEAKQSDLKVIAVKFMRGQDFHLTFSQQESFPLSSTQHRSLNAQTAQLQPLFLFFMEIFFLVFFPQFYLIRWHLLQLFIQFFSQMEALKLLKFRLSQLFQLFWLILVKLQHFKLLFHHPYSFKQVWVLTLLKIWHLINFHVFIFSLHHFLTLF